MTITSPDHAKFKRQLAKTMTELDGSGARKRLAEAVRMASTVDVPEAVRRTPSAHGSLADQSMSHWWRGRAITIGGGSNVKSDSLGEVFPSGRARGPMRVLESGRQAHAIGEGMLRYKMTKTKGLRVRRRIVGAKTGRGIGGTRPKHTWTHATLLMSERTPDRMRKSLVGDMKKIWRG